MSDNHVAEKSVVLPFDLKVFMDNLAKDKERLTAQRQNVIEQGNATINKINGAIEQIDLIIAQLLNPVVPPEDELPGPANGEQA